MKKILVIEDEALTRNLFLECLEAKGFYTIGAENGLIGVQRVQEELPDLVICDIVMPELDGYGVLSKLRQNPVTAIIPIIFLTAKFTKAELRQVMKLGADDYLTKPCKLEELLGAIAACLEKQATLRQWFAALAQQVPPPPADGRSLGGGNPHSITDNPITPTTRQNGSALPESCLEPTNCVNAKAPPSIFPSVLQLREVFDYIEANYHQPISLCDVARAAGYSPGYLTDLMRRQTGQTVQRWIISRRIAAACSLLMQTDQSVEQIAALVGYQNAVHFFRQFRQLHQTTPQAWRTSQRTQLCTE